MARFEMLDERQMLSISFPTASANITVNAGAPLPVALNATSDSAITYTVASSNSSIVAPTVETGKSVQISVTTAGNAAATGTITLQLYDNDPAIAAAVARFEQLVNQGFYNSPSEDFFRVIQGAIQGGDPKNNGTGGSGTQFDDAFDSSLRFTTGGVLAMAKSTDNTNDSQFFITTAANRGYDFNYTIIGFLTSGSSVLNAIEAVKVQNNSSGEDSQPVTPVVINSITMVTDQQDGEVLLSAPATATANATATVTVTATDANNETATETLNVTIQADSPGVEPPFWTQVLPATKTATKGSNGLTSFAWAETTQNTTFTYQIPAPTVNAGTEGSTIYYAATIDPSYSSYFTVSTNSSTGVVTITPLNNVVGVASLRLTVAYTATDAQDQYETYSDNVEIPVLVDPAKPSNVQFYASAANGSPEYLVTGVFSGAAVTLYTDDGSPATLSQVGTGTGDSNGEALITTTASPGSHTLVATQSLSGTTGQVTSGNHSYTLTLTSPQALFPVTVALDINSTPSSYTVEDGTNYSYTATIATTVSSPSTLIWGLEEAPTGMSIATTTNSKGLVTGVISWIPTSDQVGQTFTVIVVAEEIASDGTTVQASGGQEFNLQVLQNYGVSGPGLFNTAAAAFYLRDTDTPGPGNSITNYGPHNSNWSPLAGDWDGDGAVTLGLYDPTTSTFYLKQSNGQPDIVVQYGPPHSNWLPVVGDWDGNGTTTIGLYNQATSTFYLKNSNTAGGADIKVPFGAPNSGLLPLAGDWNGSGKTYVGVYSPTSGWFYLRTALAGGGADISLNYGPAGRGWLPIAGDWNESGEDHVGLYSPETSIFYLRNEFSSGIADSWFQYGWPGGGLWPIVGSWNAPLPSGYTITADNSTIGSGSTAGFTFANATVKDTYAYTITSSGGGTPVTGTGTVSSAKQDVSGISLSGLANGTLTFSVRLTNDIGNTGNPATATATLFSIATDESIVGASNATATGFTFSNAVAGDKYTYTVTSSGGGKVTGTGTVASAAQDISAIDVSSLPAGTLTYSVTLTDSSGKVGSPATATLALFSVSVNSGYLSLSSTNAASNGFTINSANSVTSDTYSYTLTDQNGTKISGPATTSYVPSGLAVTGIDLSSSGLVAGPVTLSVTLTDASGKTSTAATATAKLTQTGAPDFTVTPDGITSTNPTIDATHAKSFGFTMTFNNNMAWSTYSYTISSSGNSGGTPVSSSGSVLNSGTAGATQDLTGIDVSGLADGYLTISVTLTDATGTITDTETNSTAQLSQLVPGGYNIFTNNSTINKAQSTATSFTLQNDATGDTYKFTITDKNGKTVSGSGTVTTVNQTVSTLDGTTTGPAINVSGLADGTLTFSLTLTSPGGTVGPVATATATLDTVAPTGYSIKLDETSVDATNATSTGFTLFSSEVTTNSKTPVLYQCSVLLNGAPTGVTTSGEVTADAATTTGQNVTGIDVSGLANGTLTYSVTVTDPALNVGAPVVSPPVSLKQPVPSGYTVVAPSTIDASQAASPTFTTFTIENIANVTATTTYSYTITSSGDGNVASLPGSGSVTSANQPVTVDFFDATTGLPKLPDGNLTITVTVSNNNGANVGPAVTNTTPVAMATTVPSGYSITLDTNAITTTTTGFTINNAQVGTTYTYYIHSEYNGQTITGTGTITGTPGQTTTDFHVTTSDLSSLGASGASTALDFYVTLTDAAGNIGPSLPSPPANATMTLP